MREEENMGSQHPWVKMSWKYRFMTFPLSWWCSFIGYHEKEVGNTEYFHLFKIQSLSWMVIGVWKEGKDFFTRPVLSVVSPRVGNSSLLRLRKNKPKFVPQRNTWIFGELVILVICKQECEADSEPGGSLAAEQWELLARRDLSLVPKSWCSPCACVFTGELCRQNSQFWEQELEF